MQQTDYRNARLAEGGRAISVFDIRDAPTLRLQMLKADLAPVIDSLWRPGLFFDLQLVAGNPPRLILDLVSSVVMEPDPRTFRLTCDTDDGQEVLFETRDRAQMVERIRQLIANGSFAQGPDTIRTAERRRGECTDIPSDNQQRLGIVDAALRPVSARTYSAAAVWLAWLSGLVMGCLILFVFGVWMAGKP
jgi:hypothetical protein